MIKVTTDCCALCQIARVNNDTNIDILKNAINQLRKEKLNNKEVGVTTGDGQTAAFVIVSPGEYILENNLKILNFKHIHTFERRKGYPEIGDLKMYILNL